MRKAPLVKIFKDRLQNQPNKSNCSKSIMQNISVWSTGVSLHAIYKTIEKFCFILSHITNISNKLTPAIFVADVREPPDVAEIHGEPHHSEEELRLLAPSVALRNVLLLADTALPLLELGKEGVKDFIS